MKNKLLIGIFVMLASNCVLASTTLNITAPSNQSWVSRDTKDVKTFRCSHYFMGVANIILTTSLYNAQNQPQNGIAVTCNGNQGLHKLFVKAGILYDSCTISCKEHPNEYIQWHSFGDHKYGASGTLSLNNANE